MDCCCSENVQKLNLYVNLRTRSSCTYAFSIKVDKTPKCARNIKIELSIIFRIIIKNLSTSSCDRYSLYC